MREYCKGEVWWNEIEDEVDDEVDDDSEDEVDDNVDVGVDLQTVTGDGDLALQARVREPGEEERGEGDNTASSA